MGQLCFFIAIDEIKLLAVKNYSLTPVKLIKAIFPAPHLFAVHEYPPP
jgi:hypothetical protein